MSSFRGILRAAIGGILLDLCNHGILIVGMNFYKKGIRLGQLVAFLVASPWNSFSLTVILIALIGWMHTIVFIFLSFVIAIVSGIIFEVLVRKEVLPSNPYVQEDPKADPHPPLHLKRELTNGVKAINLRFLVSVVSGGVRESKMILKWLFLGVVIMACITTFVAEGIIQTYFGSDVRGTFINDVSGFYYRSMFRRFGTYWAHLVTQNKALGNGFAFLMAGVATDYTEIMALKETSRSWKIAFFLPLITLPQILLIGWLLNGLGH